MNWSNKVDSILIEEARLFTLKSVIDFNDSVLVQLRDSLRQAIQLKSQLHLDKKQYIEALKTSELLFSLDANDATALIEDYYQTAWLALFTQNYALATLYSQNSLDLDKEIVGSRLLQIYTFILADKKEEAETARAKLNSLINKNKLEEWVIRDLGLFEFHGLSEADRLKLRQIFNP